MAKSTAIAPSNTSNPAPKDQEVVTALMGSTLDNVGVQVLDDGSVQFTLAGRDAVTKSENITVILRDMTGDDLLAMEEMPGGDIEKTMRTISRLCIKWGKLKVITFDQVKQVRAKHITVVGQVFANFLN